MLNETQPIFDRLVIADRVHQKEAGSRLVLCSVKYVCAAVLLGFVLDVIFHLGSVARLGLLLLLLAAVAALACIAWRRAFVQRNRVEYTARFLESRDPALGSRLINLLQLQEQAADPKLAPRTRDLARQAVEGYAAGLRSVPVESIARTGEVRVQAKRASWFVLGFLAVLALCFSVTTTELLRFLDPFGDHPPYSFTTLTITDPGAAGATVAYGKGLIIKVNASGHQPKEVFLTSYPPGHPEQALTLPMFDEGGVGFNQQLDHIKTDLIVFAHTKDHASESKQVRIGVVLTPRLETAFVRIAPPDYTRLKAEEKPYDFKGVQALEGSRVQFRLQSNRPLREGWVEVSQGEKAAEKIALKKSGENEVTGSFVASDSGRLRLGVVDESGLPSQGDHESGLTVTHDLPPEVHITNPPHDAVVAMDFKLQVQVESSDDYGLTKVRFHCGVNGTFGVPQEFKYDPFRLDSRETIPLDFATMGVKPGDTISLFADAIDNAPQPHLSHSQTIHLTVISVEDYNNFLREQSDISQTEAKYSQLNNDLQNLIDQQRALGDQAQKLSEQLATADPKQKEALAQQLDKLIAQQNELNHKLNNQAARMENFVRQQPVYDVEKDMQAMLQQQAQNVRASTQANDAASKSVAQSSSPSSGSRQLSPQMLSDFKAASDAQVAKLGQSHDETEQKVVQPLQDMSTMQELVKDFNEFEALTKAQTELTQQAQAYNRAGQLSREDQLALKDIAASQDAVGQSLHELREKLGDDSKAAHQLFPKASRSGADLADAIGTNLMEPLAAQATGQMLAGNGDQSFQLADRLRGAMERLFGQCQGGNSPSPDELDSYLRLQHLTPGSNFAQMKRSHRLGTTKGHGQAGGEGAGAEGSSGYAVEDGVSLSVLGNETMASQSKHPSRESSPYGHGAGQLHAADRGSAENPDVINGLNPVNRHSGANVPETEIEEYNDVVDNYFKTIATRKEKPADAKTP